MGFNRFRAMAAAYSRCLSKMNSGLFRLWAALSVAWVLFFALIHPVSWPANSWIFSFLSFQPTPRWGWMNDVLIWGAQMSDHLILYALWGLSFPVATLVLWHTATWVGSGFRQAQR